ncbi:C6 transcription factor [Colletotrichum truncatum]|uniref:C6 transcription factor n=1 Tax=Colletotrichum truncatum TaxID=5467 RepID=A0ACC3Z1W2_COLTU|nr:C6 transcription factor [Colletotrichum truncatum]KAF6781370.1 C6 transcription factor [Colletotrichum truncatum]
MVNRGRLSPACFPCRSRKLRCDLQKDTCGQCQRAKIACHGYRDPAALQFRDESLSIEQRALSSGDDDFFVRMTSRPGTLELNWDARARYAFFSTYINGFTRSMGEVAYYCRTARSSDHLSASVEAASLAFMATQLSSTYLMRLANASYVTAIRRLNHFLTELESQGAEEALQSVLLLDIYEKMVHRDAWASQAWMSHSQGGLSLLNTRASSILSSPAGCHLAARLVTAVTVSCVTKGVNTPKELATLRRNIGYRVSSPKWSFLGVLSRVYNLHFDFERGKVSKRDFVVRAKCLDDHLETLDKTVPSAWRPQTIQISENDVNVLGSCYDVYPDHYTTQVVNALRTMRLILYSISKHHVSDVNYIQKTISPETVCTLTRQVCASVPQFILPGVRTSNSIPFSPLQQLQCRTFLTPLYFVHQISEEASVREWVRRCMRFMWEYGNMRTAKDIADVMETRPNLNYWTVFAMTGSYAFSA